MKINVAAVVIAALASSISAQEPKKTEPQPEIVYKLTLERFMKIMQAMGFECRKQPTEAGKPDTYFKFRAEGYSATAIVDADSDGEYALLYAGFSDVHATPDFISEWNSHLNFSRAYREDDSTAIAMDVIVSGGVTVANIEAQINTFRSKVGRFVRGAVDSEKSSTGQQKQAPSPK